MPTKISQIEVLVRERLSEPTPRFWSSSELTNMIIAGIKDLWRPTADLKEEHYLTETPSGVVTLQASTDHLTGVPADVHKIVLIRPSDISESSSTVNLRFMPASLNSDLFIAASSRAAIEPSNDVIYYAITGKGAPVEAPKIRIAPQVSSAVNVQLAYVPTLPELTADSFVPIPGEADNALVAWTTAYARGKETEDRSPDPNWLSIYKSEKTNLLQSLGLRQYQEPTYVDGLHSEYW